MGAYRHFEVATKTLEPAQMPNASCTVRENEPNPERRQLESEICMHHKLQCTVHNQDCRCIVPQAAWCTVHTPVLCTQKKKKLQRSSKRDQNSVSKSPLRDFASTRCLSKSKPLRSRPNLNRPLVLPRQLWRDLWTNRALSSHTS